MDPKDLIAKVAEGQDPKDVLEEPLQEDEETELAKRIYDFLHALRGEGIVPISRIQSGPRGTSFVVKSKGEVSLRGTPFKITVAPY